MLSLSFYASSPLNYFWFLYVRVIAITTTNDPRGRQQLRSQRIKGKIQTSNEMKQYKVLLMSVGVSFVSTLLTFSLVYGAQAYFPFSIFECLNDGAVPMPTCPVPTRSNNFFAIAMKRKYGNFPICLRTRVPTEHRLYIAASQNNNNNMQTVMH